MISRLLKTFKKQDEEISYLKPEDIKIEDNNIMIPEISIQNYNPNMPVILIMDDYPGMISLIHDDIQFLEADYKYRYNILESTGNFAAFSVLKYLEDDNNPKIDYAFLDITLGGIVVKDGKVVEHDGVDVAIKILESNPAAQVRFITGHTINRKNPELFKFIKKFEDKTGNKIDNYVITKNSSRAGCIQRALEGELCN